MKLQYRSNKGSWLRIILSVVMMLVVIFPITQSYFTSFRFVDEDEYMVNGYLMNKGYTLFTDISTNHQPVTYILSSLVQKTANPPNTLMLLKRHREAQWAWNTIWAVLVVYAFGMAFLPALLIFEVTKFFMLGNHFLAESFAAYPLAFAFLSFLRLLVEPKKRILWFVVGLSLALCVFLLLPLVVPVLLMGTLFLRHSWRNKQKLSRLILGGLMVIVGVFIFVRPADYWHETIVNNWMYALPHLKETSGLVDYVKMFLYGFWSVSFPNNLLGLWLKLTAVVWFVSGFVLVIKKRWKIFGVWGAAALVWGLTNMRVFHPDVYFYEAFHLTQWWLVGLVGATWLVDSWKEYISRKWLMVFIAFITVISMSLLFRRDSPIIERKDPQTEHYVQFTPLERSSQVINVFAKENDTLMVFPMEVLIYWMTDTVPATRQVTHYEWQYYPPRNRAEFDQTLEKSLPLFVQLTDEGSIFAQRMKPVVDAHYQILLRFPETYVRNDVLLEATEEQWQNYGELPFEVEPKAEVLKRISGKMTSTD